MRATQTAAAWPRTAMRRSSNKGRRSSTAEKEGRWSGCARQRHYRSCKKHLHFWKPKQHGVNSRAVCADTLRAEVTKGKSTECYAFQDSTTNEKWKIWWNNAWKLIKFMETPTVLECGVAFQCGLQRDGSAAVGGAGEWEWATVRTAVTFQVLIDDHVAYRLLLLSCSHVLLPSAYISATILLSGKRHPYFARYFTSKSEVKA